MPVILDPDEYDTWLDLGSRGPWALKARLRPYPAERMEWWPVSRRVGNPANDDSSLVEPVG